MLPELPAPRWSETNVAESHPMLVFRAHVLRDVSQTAVAHGARAFLVYVDGEPSGWRFARSGRAAEVQERRTRRLPAHDAGRVRAVWVPAAPLADLVRILPRSPRRAGGRDSGR